jgi:Uma2 family endonuclease
VAILTGITIEEFERLPDALARNHELVNGELVDVSGNTGGHNRLRDFLGHLLAPLVEQRDLGMVICEQEYDFGGNVHGPDVSVIGAAKVKFFDPSRRVQLFVPDLAIEVVSKNDHFNAVTEKAIRYRTCGTKEVWVFAQKTRRVYLYSEEREAILSEDQPFESKLIPGFSIRLGELFDKA